MSQVKIKNFFEDDIKEPVRILIGHRLPWLILGLLGGILTTFIVSRFELILASDLRLAFFIPIIVYMSDAIGTQTETIYIRHIKESGADFFKYMIKESLLGLGLGLIFGVTIGLIANFWLASPQIGLTVGIAMFINCTIAPVMATFIPTILYKRHKDPALGSGPLATIIQDLISVLIYFYTASLILF